MKMIVKKILHNIKNNWEGFAYSIMAILLVFTGLVQLPLAKRYYIADVPGLGWTADYLFTHHIYYGTAVLLTALVSYKAFDYILDKNRNKRISTGGLIKVMSLSGLLISAIIKTVSQSMDIIHTQEYIVFLNFVQLSFTMFFIISSLVFIKSPEKWVTQETEALDVSKDTIKISNK